MFQIPDLLVVASDGREASHVAKTDSEMRIRLRNRECVSKREGRGGGGMTVMK